MKSVQLIALDVDGTLTDGVIHYDSAGQEHRHFYAADGLGIVMAQAVGLRIAVISGRRSNVVERRMTELGVAELHQGVGDKAAVLREIMRVSRLTPEQTAFVGDDLNDLPAFHVVGVKIAVADSCEQLREAADYVTPRGGGRGGVRDAIEEILRRQGRLEQAVAAYIQKQTMASQEQRQ